MFNEITKNAIRQAFNKPGELILIVLMPSRRVALWTAWWGIGFAAAMEKDRSWSVCRSCAAVAVRLVVEREREIKAFVPESSGKSMPARPRHLVKRWRCSDSSERQTVPSGQQRTNSGCVSLLEKARYSVLEREDKPTTVNLALLLLPLRCNKLPAPVLVWREKNHDDGAAFV